MFNDFIKEVFTDKMRKVTQTAFFEKFIWEEYEFELVRIGKKNKKQALENTKARIKDWLTKQSCSDPITVDALCYYRVPYLYFTRLGAEVTK